MAFMTGETRVMLGGMEKNIVAFCIPIVLTVILLYKHPLAFNNSNFKIIIGVLLVWSFVQIMVKHQYTPKSFANYLYYLYAITIAYIHVRIYKRKMFYLYEDVMVKLSLLSLIIWIFTNIAPGLAMQVASLFPKTSHGYNFLYLIHWISPYGRHVTYGLTRNAGCSWEPGRFAIMVCLALLINFYRKGTSFKNNKNGIVLLLSLLTTMSTTGYVLGFVLYAYMYIKGIKHVIIFTIIGIPIFYLAYQLEFVGEKIESKMKVEETVEHIEETYSWSEQNADGTLAYSMDRFPSMVFEFENFIHDPIIGYGANVLDSYFMRTRTKMIGFTGGLVTMLSKFGIIFGGFLLYILFLSSPRISSVLHSKKKYGILICMVLSMVSYPLIWFPVYTAFWFYGFFLYDETKILNIWRKLRLQ
jgi:hypothetical protein